MEIIFKAWVVILLSIISGLLYRAGGKGKPFNTKWRDLGIPVIATISLFILGIKFVWWTYLLHFGLLFGTLTTYWKLDEKKYGYWAHGLGISFAALPIIYITGNLIGFSIRTILLTGFITLWSEYTKWDILEEWGRGAIICLTLPMLLI